MGRAREARPAEWKVVKTVKKLKRQYWTVAIFVGVAIGAVACGQNANVTRSDLKGTWNANRGAGNPSAGSDPFQLGKTPTQMSAETPDGGPSPSPSPSPSASVEPSPSPSPSASPEAEANVPPPIGENDPNHPGDSSVSNPSDPTHHAGQPGNGPVTGGIGGSNGGTGRDGRDGRDGQSGQNGQNGCGLYFYNASFDARPMTREEKAQYALPYKEAKVEALDIGDPNKATSYGVKYVRDGQVRFAVDAYLPPAESVRSVRKIRLVFDVMKLSGDGYKDTEMFCLLDQKLCSGHSYMESDPSWRQYFNRAFGDSARYPINKAFADRDVGREVARIPLSNRSKAGTKYGTLYAHAAAELTFADLINGSEMSDPAVLLYGTQPRDRNVKRTFPMVVTDDTFVRSVRLEVVLEIDTCISSELNRRAQTVASPELATPVGMPNQLQ